MAFMAAKNLTETHSANAAVRQFIHRIPSAICVTVAMMHGAMADNFADYRNGRGLRYLVPALSLDTTPITVRMGSLIYHIPKTTFYPLIQNGVFF
jgi:hypothetical protein